MQLELAAGQVDRAAADERLELVGADLDLAGDDRRRSSAGLGAAAAAHDGLDAGDELLGVARLGEPVVGAQPQPAHALGDGRAAGADDDARPGRPAHSRSRSSQARGAEHARSTTSAPRRIATSVLDAARRPRARGAPSPGAPCACPAPAGSRSRCRSPRPGARATSRPSWSRRSLGQRPRRCEPAGNSLGHTLRQRASFRVARSPRTPGTARSRRTPPARRCRRRCRRCARTRARP